MKNLMESKYTPKAACRKICIQCLGMARFDAAAIEDCQGDQAANGACPLYPYRMGRRISVKVFRAHCLCCMGGNRVLVSECETFDCELHPYRIGKNPAMAGRDRLINLSKAVCVGRKQG